MRGCSLGCNLFLLYSKTEGSIYTSPMQEWIELCVCITGLYPVLIYLVCTGQFREVKNFALAGVKMCSLFQTLGFILCLYILPFQAFECRQVSLTQRHYPTGPSYMALMQNRLP